MEHPSPQASLKKVLDLLGSQAALASVCGVTQPAVSLWLRVQLRLPAEHVLKVEAATGVSRHDLRPDIYPRELSGAPQPSAPGPHGGGQPAAPQPPSGVAGPADASSNPGANPDGGLEGLDA